MNYLNCNYVMIGEQVNEDTTTETNQRKWTVTMDVFKQELKKSSLIAAPMAAAMVLQYLLSVVSMMMVGHLGQLSLSSVAIATSLANVTGFSLLSGLADGLETLCGQAFGAKQYQKLGTYAYSAIISLTLVCPPVCILWNFMDKLLIVVGQDADISHEARKYSLWLIPALFGGAVLRPMTRFLQTQSLTLPILCSSFLVLCFHVPFCWILVYKLKLGTIGAALAFDLSTWINVVLLGFYVMLSSDCEQTRVQISRDAFLEVPEFFRYAVPAAAMVCLKWWSCELLILLSGLLPNPELETSVLSICLTISSLHSTIPYGFGAAASTRVSNELSAGNPDAARVAAMATMFLAIMEAIIVGGIMFCCRNILGSAYIDEEQVVHYIAVLTPFIWLLIVLDSMQAIVSGVAKGSGWQHIGAYINLAALYVVGLPVGVVLGFVVRLRAKGLWLGIVAGSAVQVPLLSLVACFTNWQEQANKARERLAVNGSHTEH